MDAIKRRTIRIGTRKSRLALVQTKMVAEAIEASCPEAKCELVPLMTKGDKILKTSLVAFGGKGAFVEEFEQSLLNGDIDLAVHSAKDMPMDLSDGLCIGAVLKREDPRDVFVTVKDRVPERSPRIIGTGSPRRQVQIMEHGDVECRLLRGNIDTRLEKLYQGEYDGIILAAAGLNRLGLFNDPRFSFEFLEPEMFLPAGGQGIIAVEAKKGSEVLKILKKLNDKEAERALFAERKVLRLLGAGCTAAVGVYAKEENGTFWMGLMRETKNGLIRRKISGAPEDSMKLAELLVKKGTEGELPAGKAYLVGAGPGNGGLITVKGQQILKAAEVLVYDRLGSEELLTLVPEDCERIYVGKEAGHHIKKHGRGREYLGASITPAFLPGGITTKAWQMEYFNLLKENGETSGQKLCRQCRYSISSSENVCPCAEAGKFLIPRAKQGSKVLTETLAEQGYAFDDIPIYDILVEQTELARLKTADYITFESGSGVRGFFAGREAEAASLFETVRPVCIGKVTAAVLAEYGVKNALTASDYTADGILEVLLADRNEIAR